MCGIICLVRYVESTVSLDTVFTREEITTYLKLLEARGPDKSNYQLIQLDNICIFMGFTRLAIVDMSDRGLQPFTNSSGSVSITNGEIYNYQNLINKYNIVTRSTSDCEVILPLLDHVSIETALTSELDAEFATIILSRPDNKLYAARDRYGVRPLYYGYDSETRTIGFASELKALHPFMDHIEQQIPGRLATIDLSMSDSDMAIKDLISWSTYFNNQKLIAPKLNITYHDIQDKIKYLLTEAVRKRLNADRQVGFLLSGGLDSSLIVAIASRILGPDKMVCFSIGLDDSPDVIAAKSVTDYLGIKNHIIVPFAIADGINALQSTIQTIETYDVTTVRASVPQYIMARYISSNTNVRVLLSGEGSDEIHGSYRYFRDAPSTTAFDIERLRLLTDLYLFDNKRTDRTMAGAGLEVRVPFLDFDYVDFIMHLDPSLFTYGPNQMEKQIIRDSFRGYLPDEILYRSKEAFSDAVSSNEVNWAEAVKDLARSSITPEDEKRVFKNNPPLSLDALYFRLIFSKIYPMRSNVLPYYWLPKFQSELITDPSARVLPCY